MQNVELSKQIKEYALGHGADLVGIASVDRWNKAPIEHSPQGVLPGCQSVVVCAVHYLDSCVELGGEADVRNPGPAISTGIASAHCNYVGYKVAKLLEKNKWDSLVIPATLEWNNRVTKGAPRGMIGDISNIYAAPAAGLGELGWNNLALTPKYGPRQRFISILTKAPLVPDPMYQGKPLCDKCLLCAKHCPMHTFEKEVSGMCEIDYGERKFSFPNRNLWRCGIGEYFQYDVLKEWPDVIDEKAVKEYAIKAVTEHPEWIKTWKMGICLKYCVPPARRYFDKSFSKSPRRLRDVTPDESQANIGKLFNAITQHASKIDVDIVGAASLDALASFGIDLHKYLPSAKSAIIIGQSYPSDEYKSKPANKPKGSDNRCDDINYKVYGVNQTLMRNAMWTARKIQDDFGFDVVVQTEINKDKTAMACGIATEGHAGLAVTEEFGPNQAWEVIVTSVPLEKSFQWVNPSAVRIVSDTKPSPEELTESIRKLALNEGADLFGVAPAERVSAMIGQIEKIYAGEDYFIAREMGWNDYKIPFRSGRPHNIEIEKETYSGKKPEACVPNAKSVIVLGLRMLDGSIDSAGQPPAFKAGHYDLFTNQESRIQLSDTLLKVAKLLNRYGYHVSPSLDLCGTSTRIGVLDEPDIKACRFTAVAAGLGEIGMNGLVLTPEFGARQRFIALVTDAPLVTNPMYDGKPLCKKCNQCIAACPTCSISEQEKVTLNIGGKTVEWGKVNRLRCDWSQKYGLVADEGPKFMGNTNDFAPPDVITPEVLKETLDQSDNIQVITHYCPIVEQCFTKCQAHLE